MKIFFTALSAAVILVLIWFFGTPYGKGFLGETRVKLIIGRTVDGKRYVLNDFMLGNGESSSQIDHIVINKNGVYVIETKNYSGRIYGSDSQKTWTQTLAFGRVKNKLYSPVKQNLAHVCRLSEATGNAFYISSVVVFVQNNTKYVLSDCVIPISALKKRLELPQKRKPYTEAEMKQIYESLLAVRSTSVTKREHIERIKERKRTVSHNICPYCGRVLVKRSGQYGEFYGCQGYPECTFTKK